MNMYFAKRFAIKNFREPRVLVLLVAMIRELEKNNYKLLPKVLLSKTIPSGKRNRISNKINNKIVTSESYGEVLTEYDSIIDLVQRENFIMSLSTSYNYDFMYIDENDNEVFIEDMDKVLMSMEIIEFIKSV
ncbi:hypothetical protein FPHOBKDP_00228 [Listeria phage LPJP1]|nr:hypothetical protein FPHOBKDP_00228 [Listeria phage LPJP1]